MIYRTLLIIIILFGTTAMANNILTKSSNLKNNITCELLYDNVTATIYHAEASQCDNTPTITGDGSKIIPEIASELRWIAISQEMLLDTVRAKMFNRPDIDRFRGKIQYGDTVWIESENENIKGWWVVHDTKNARLKNDIDFLQTKGDRSLYNNNMLWSGRFYDLKIYKFENVPYKQIKNNDVFTCR